MTNRTTLTKDNAQAVIDKWKPVAVGDIAAALGFFCVMIGQGGAGKTTLAADMYKLDDPGKTVVLNSDAGVDAISHLGKAVEVVNIRKYKEFKDFTAAAKAGDLPWTQYIIDNVVSLASQDLEDIAGGRDQVEIQEYGKMTRDILFDTKEWRNIAQYNGYNVVMNAWDELEEDKDGRKRRGIALTPALQKEFPGSVTIIGHVQVTSDPDWRCLTFAPGLKTIAKFRRSLNVAAQKIPWEIWYQVDNLPMADIIRTWRGEQDWPEAKYKKPNGVHA